MTNLINNKIKLENNCVYYIICETKINEKFYYYMMSQDLSEINFCEIIDNNYISIIKDSKLLKQLIKKIHEETRFFCE